MKCTDFGHVRSKEGSADDLQAQTRGRYPDGYTTNEDVGRTGKTDGRQKGMTTAGSGDKRHDKHGSD